MQEGEDLFAHINMVKVLVNQLCSIEVMIEDQDMYMVLFMSLPHLLITWSRVWNPCPRRMLTFNSLSLDCFMRFSKRKESESTENATLFNKTHKANEKLCFYCKKPGHVVRNCLKKKNDEKEKAIQACEDQKQMFVATFGVNDHTMYD
jgi:hypothetical protein